MNKWLTSTLQAYHDHFTVPTSPVIWDVGSRDGDDGVELGERLGGVAMVTCVEANPWSAERIRDRHPGVTVHECAVSDYNGTSDFVCVVSEEKAAVGMSSLDVAHQETKGHWDKRIVTVQVTRLETIMPNGIIDIMKIDCEGYSWEVLHGMGERLHDVRVLHVETEHPEFSAWSHEGHRNNEEVRAFMESEGFELVATEYEWGGIQDQVYVNKRL